MEIKVESTSINILAYPTDIKISFKSSELKDDFVIKLVKELKKGR